MTFCFNGVVVFSAVGVAERIVALPCLDAAAAAEAAAAVLGLTSTGLISRSLSAVALQSVSMVSFPTDGDLTA